MGTVTLPATRRMIGCTQRIIHTILRKTFLTKKTPIKSSSVLLQLDSTETRDQYHAKARVFYPVASRAHALFSL